jgi:hypothetical protein
MKHSIFEKMIETVFEPHNYIDGLEGTSKSPLRLQNSWERLPGEIQFLKRFYTVYIIDRELNKKKQRNQEEKRIFFTH